MSCRRLRCPACGLFGRRARRRAADAEAQNHIAWAASLLAPQRSPEPVRMLHDDVDEYAAFHRRQVEAMDSPWKGMALGLHDHAPDEPCEATCTFYPAVTYDTADVVAETIGQLTYEEQSEMFGDPIADVIRRETE
ncbi:hypothetical protein PHELEMICH_92 [Mycobacterium phage Phelemich]|uniref:Uncharacterized protein n=1 Tax=Mycobacterium phage Phelemich TaxID=1383055 RepID=S5Z946_9CAUD|nr:hypothetical protein N847_gp92 [Mycobacterium phage Phelemich]AGT14006.1 hypothetical protein PHELEMICH_92 [Mycobacterium phage Phelemich]